MIAVARLYGLRSFAKMSSVDFASTIATGSILATIAVNPDQSLLKGTVALLTVVGFQNLFSYVKRNFSAVEAATENSPVFLMYNGRILHRNLARCGVTNSDLMAKLREANVLRLADVRAVVFETTGDVSVLHGEGPVDAQVLAGVRPGPYRLATSESLAVPRGR